MLITELKAKETILALASGKVRRGLMGVLDLEEYDYSPDSASPIRATEASDKYHLGVAAPILSQGDLMGCVMLLMNENTPPLQESDQTLAQTAEFLCHQRFSFAMISFASSVYAWLPLQFLS